MFLTHAGSVIPSCLLLVGEFVGQTVVSRLVLLLFPSLYRSCSERSHLGLGANNEPHPHVSPWLEKRLYSTPPLTTLAASYCICSYLGLNCAELCLSVSCPWLRLFNLRDEQSLKPDSYHRWPDSRVIARNEPHRIHHYAIPFTDGINSQKTIRHDFSDSHIRDTPFADPV